MRIDHNPPAIIELAEERDRKTCVALGRKAESANREVGQWLLANDRYTPATVAKWFKEDGVQGFGERKLQFLLRWAEDGFTGRPFDRDHQPKVPSGEALKTNDNFEDDAFEPEEGTDSEGIVGGVEYADQTLKNISASISESKRVAEAWRKILKATPFDREAKAQIYNEIKQLIMKWRNVQTTLDRKGQGNGQK